MNSFDSDSDGYIRTLGFLARNARFEAMVPGHSRARFEKRYYETTGESALAGESGYYLHEGPVDKWGAELRISFSATEEELGSLEFGSRRVTIRRGPNEGEYRINNNRLIWELWGLGFRNGDKQDPSLVRRNLPEAYRGIFDLGYGDQSLVLKDLDDIGRDYSRNLEQASRSGEGTEHLQLKQYVAGNPATLGLFVLEDGVQEYLFVSGDRCDVVFDLRESGMCVVEVKGSALAELVKGVYQAIKYRALMEAEKGKGSPFPVRAILVAQSSHEPVNKLAQLHDVKCVVVPRRTVQQWHARDR